MSDVWTIRRILTWTTGHFEKRGVDAPRLTAEILLAYVLKTGRVRLYVDLDRPLSKDELAAFKALIERRLAGEPTNYLTGTKEFYNRPFKVDARVLIPRPETELLVEAVLHAVPRDAPSRVLDVCTGSGCIAISVAAERPQATVLATDLSKDACALARENAQALNVAERVSVLEGDLFAPLPPDATFRVVVSNPPYIDSGDIAGLSPEVRREPRLALDGGPDGLVALRRVIQGARRVLEPGGLLALEMGETQGSAVLELLRAAGYSDARVEKDLERRERMAFGTQPAA
ncbi:MULTISPECIES: peptide chain release factor N(5)-glutamine methyltransferase [unclassified Corallococcus]|uniref:peptide chain release factor N(5)-glutamine methyltransferase n=1 Tax=unclassified Corallococcus TaxID=2685029 RepID=UPI001A8D577B|nr:MULTISPECIES: peptide chain release factor N(5)-glutamine methyltransferase [unclassified Corallococcus]MBN9686740.1 peptide chain release factor N(5)-glutamine methyltransferase [Corallococcus sp. NCSPR001]WAS81844.1 peptide chain release factor N(5)-glutamine methyltransferase [Corallococcus sp. NCRR]